ncbi:MAG TPA: hypothetical protein VK155_02800 [Bacteroidales bacterium]|jgi:hypothetical protein|nr:hypothetical protein [Bacteroidales bacterium]
MNLTSIITSEILYIHDERSVDAYSKDIGEFNLIYERIKKIIGDKIDDRYDEFSYQFMLMF